MSRRVGSQTRDAAGPELSDASSIQTTSGTLWNPHAEPQDRTRDTHRTRHDTTLVARQSRLRIHHAGDAAGHTQFGKKADTEVEKTRANREAASLSLPPG